MPWDYVIVGSGFGGSVSALRLVEKGYRVLVLEKGRRFRAEDFAKTNWNLRRWLWLPRAGLRGIFKMTFMRHVTALTGVGVGGGSLVYANTLPIPKDEFYAAPSWAHLADWKTELAPHYQTGRRMLGVTRNPELTYPDEVIREVGKEIGRADFEPTQVAVYFGESGVTVKDPYFGGEGPDRTGCIRCGGCMVGCRYGAKNTLDLNYLWLAEKRGLAIEADTEVTWVRPAEGGGYEVEALQGARIFGRTRKTVRARQVIFAGGVIGTVDLLLKLKASPDGLPKLSDRLGDHVRTNSEVLVGVVSGDRQRDLSKGIAIGSILHTDPHSHIEPVRYSSGSGFLRLLAMPFAPGETLWARLLRSLATALRNPIKLLRTLFVLDWARHTMILLYMRTTEGTLRLRKGRSLLNGFTDGLTSAAGSGPPAKASIPEATDLVHRVSRKLQGFPMSMVAETFIGSPTTAHILGGCCMGDSAENGVVDHRHRVFGYEGLYVIDGSAISANPGVNPALTITSLAERAMTFIPEKGGEARASS